MTVYNESIVEVVAVSDRCEAALSGPGVGAPLTAQSITVVVPGVSLMANAGAANATVVTAHISVSAGGVVAERAESGTSLSWGLWFLNWVEVVSSPRVAREELGDAREALHQMTVEGRPPLQIKVRAVVLGFHAIWHSWLFKATVLVGALVKLLK